MQIPVQHTTNSVREMRRMQTPLWRRGLRGLRNVRLVVYLLIGGWVAIGLIAKALQATPPNSHDLASGVGLLLLVLVVPVIYYWRAQREVTKSLAAQGTATLDLTSAGVSTTQANGVSGFEPWSSFTSFQEGKHTVVLARQGKAAAQIIPVESLDAATRGTLRSLLLSNLPERT